MRLLQFVTSSDGEDATPRVGVEVEAASAATGGAGGAGAGAGAASDAAVLDITAAFTSDAPPAAGAAAWVRDGMRSLLEGGADALAAVQAAVSGATGAYASFVVPRSRVLVRAPIYNPEKMLCVGMNYVDHCTGALCRRGVWWR